MVQVVEAVGSAPAAVVVVLAPVAAAAADRYVPKEAASVASFYKWKFGEPSLYSPCLISCSPTRLRPAARGYAGREVRGNLVR